MREQQDCGDKVVDENNRFYCRQIAAVLRQLHTREWRGNPEDDKEGAGNSEDDATLVRRRRRIRQRE